METVPLAAMRKRSAPFVTNTTGEPLTCVPITAVLGHVALLEPCIVTSNANDDKSFPSRIRTLESFPALVLRATNTSASEFAE